MRSLTLRLPLLRSFAILLLSVSFSVSHLTDALADTNEDLFADIKAMQSTREQTYANGHFVWEVTDIDGSDRTHTRYEYWANSGKFFRLDSYTLKDGKPDGQVRRLISTPEATTLVIAKTPDDSGVVSTSTSVDICVNGVCPPDLESITGQFFIAHGNRYATIQVKNLIEKWETKSYDLVSLDVTQNDKNACVISFVRQKPEGRRIGSVVMDPKTYRVRSWTYKFEGEDGKRRAVQHSVFVYGVANGDIPTEEHSFARSNFQPIGSTTVKLLEFDLAPTKLDAFNLPKG
ncbi:hypothetical protein [Novipirellula aureliae]|nr:hypothetical protein [Novipirellula aureliae]